MFPKILLVDTKVLSPKQLTVANDYTRMTINKYSNKKELITKYLTGSMVVIGLGYGRKSIQSEQECSRQALINLGLAFTLKENIENL